MTNYRNTRKIHQYVTIGAVLFLLASVITGLLWAYAPYLYWADGYKQRKHDFSPQDIARARFSVSDIIQKTESRFGKDSVLEELTLSSDAGMLLYDVRYRGSDGKVHRTLLDAKSGDWISPLNEETALRIARQYVLDIPPVEAVSLEEAWIPRKKNTGRPAWVVRFSDNGGTEIILDPATGEILEDQDNIRRFHFFIMKLHQFNFFGFKKVLTIIPGLPLLIAIITGSMMWATPKWRNYAKKRIARANLNPESPQAGRASVKS